MVLDIGPLKVSQQVVATGACSLSNGEGSLELAQDTSRRRWWYWRIKPPKAAGHLR
jgi:hypothetical protein